MGFKCYKFVFEPSLLRAVFAEACRLGLHSSSAIYCPVVTPICEGHGCQAQRSSSFPEVTVTAEEKQFITVQDKPS